MLPVCAAGNQAVLSLEQCILPHLRSWPGLGILVALLETLDKQPLQPGGKNFVWKGNGGRAIGDLSTLAIGKMAGGNAFGYFRRFAFAQEPTGKRMPPFH
jgi:hypothetical protein